MRTSSPPLCKQLLKGTRCLPAILLSQASKQCQIHLIARGLDYMARVREVLRTARKDLHGDEVFPADYSQRLSLKWNVDRTIERRELQAAQTYEQVDSIFMLIRQHQHRSNRVIRVPVPELGFEISRNEPLLQITQFLRR